MNNYIVGLSAYMWWKSKRPEGWTITEHLNVPHINTVGNSEFNLACAVADSIRSGFTLTNEQSNIES